MRRGSHDMQVNVAGIRRNLKNLAHNYSDAQKKVREATSNDPWGPSSTLMAEIADLTYNVVAFSEIMQMVWKRLNDHGRNWRHVYKALVLLEYLIKTGSEKVGQQCKENIFAVQTLKDFQHLEEGKDQGQNVREKAKQLVNLLKDDERLKNERARALKAKERFAQSASGFGSDNGLDTPCSPKYPAFRGEWGANREPDLPREIEIARPQTAGEEELQLQLALAMSREEAEQEEQKRKSDDVRLQLALSQSQQDFKTTGDEPKKSHVLDLLDVSLTEQPPMDPWEVPPSTRAPGGGLASPWQSPPPVMPHPPHGGHNNDPWRPVEGAQWGEGPTRHDPWSPVMQGSSPSPDFDEFDVITNRNHKTTNGSGHGAPSAGDPFEVNILSGALSGTTLDSSTGATKKTPHSFLGENSALVNLDNLVTSKPANATLVANPFSDSQSQANQQQQQQQQQRAVFGTPVPPKLSINEMKQAALAPFAGGPNPAPQVALAASASRGFGSANYVNSFQGAPQDPWTPAPPVENSWAKNNEANPFLS